MCSTALHQDDAYVIFTECSVMLMPYSPIITENFSQLRRSYRAFMGKDLGKWHLLIIVIRYSFWFSAEIYMGKSFRNIPRSATTKTWKRAQGRSYTVKSPIHFMLCWILQGKSEWKKWVVASLFFFVTILVCIWLHKLKIVLIWLMPYGKLFF